MAPASCPIHLAGSRSRRSTGPPNALQRFAASISQMLSPRRPAVSARRAKPFGRPAFGMVPARASQGLDDGGVGPLARLAEFCLCRLTAAMGSEITPRALARLPHSSGEQHRHLCVISACPREHNDWSVSNDIRAAARSPRLPSWFGRGGSSHPGAAAWRCTIPSQPDYTIRIAPLRSKSRRAK